MKTLLVPDMIPQWVWGTRRAVSRVVHEYPDDWLEKEVDEHRYDDCPCSPDMIQDLEEPYTWRCEHKRIPETEKWRLA